MGLFSRIKNNLGHGGVKLQIQAPSSISMEQGSVPITVTVLGGDSQVKINRVRVELIAETRSSGNQQGRTQVITGAEKTDPFLLDPKGSVVVPLALVMNVGAAIGSQLPEGGGVDRAPNMLGLQALGPARMAQVANMLQKSQELGDALGVPDDQTYYIHATADVDGIALDPSAHQPIQVLRPGQIGSTFGMQG